MGYVSEGVLWEPAVVTREQRDATLGMRGATIWITGLPASGKSTLAARLESALVNGGWPAYRLDGDNLRHGLNGDLGFAAEDRHENVRRTAEVARLMADAGLVAIVSLISPYAADRAHARAIHEADGLPFVEVWVATPVEECERRDPKGLYARARRGELKGFTGVDDPYEPPVCPDLAVLPGEDSLDAAVDRLLGLLGAHGALEP